MRCYFLRAGHISRVEVLEPGISDEDAIARAKTLASKRRGPLDSLEVWEGSRFVFRSPVVPRDATAADLAAPSDQRQPGGEKA
jgi:hypothetical protein